MGEFPCDKHFLCEVDSDLANELWSPDVATCVRTIKDAGSRHLPPVSGETVYSTVAAAPESGGLEGSKGYRHSPVLCRVEEV